MTAQALADFQARFARGLLAPPGSAPTPGHAVHRNTVQASLQDAVITSFPVTAQLVGPDFMAAAAARFVTHHPPDRGWLSAYGGDFPDFLSSFASDGEHGYLGDVARLEWARIASASSADAPALTLTDLVHIAPDMLDRLRLALHVGARLVASDWAIVDIWNAHQPTAHATALDAIVDPARPQGALVTRATPDSVAVSLLTPAELGLVTALAAGAMLTEAAEAGLTIDAAFDPGAALARLCAIRAFAALSAD